MRRLSAALASTKAIVSHERRIDGLSSDNDAVGGDKNEAASIATTCPFLPAEAAAFEADLADVAVDEDEEVPKDLDTDALFDALADIFSTTGIGRAKQKEAVTGHLATFFGSRCER